MGEIETTNKVVGMLIKVLHADYAATRDLAVVQLMLLGKKAIPPLITYLKKEDAIQEDLTSIASIESFESNMPRIWMLSDEFKNKWHSRYSDISSDESRNRAIKEALKAADLLGIANIPILFPNIAKTKKFT